MPPEHLTVGALGPALPRSPLSRTMGKVLDWGPDPASKTSLPSWNLGDDDLEAALAASRSQLAELEVRAQTRANAVAEAAAVAASEAAAMHATELLS